MTEVFLLDLDWDLILHLADPDSFNVLLGEQFSEDLIEDPLAKEVFQWQLHHHREHGQVASASVLEDQFDQVNVTAPQSAIGDLIARIRNRYVRNQGRDAIEEMARMTKEDPLAVAKTMVAEGRRLRDLTEPRGESFAIEDFTRALKEYDQQTVRGAGPSLGFAEIDQHFHGQRGLTFLIAAPKGYKSWMTVNSVLSNIRYGGFPYLYSLELPAVDTYWRLACMETSIPYWKYLRGSLDPDDRKHLNQALGDLQSFGGARVEKPKQGERSVVQLVERALNVDATCVYIDQLQYVETRQGRSLGAGNDTGEYFEVLDDLRNYSDIVPIFVVHQFNRSVMGATEMPDFQAVKASSAVEETATLALGIYTNKDMRSSGVLEVGTLLSRNYSHLSWEVSVELSRGCGLTLNGETQDTEL